MNHNQAQQLIDELKKINSTLSTIKSNIQAKFVDENGEPVSAYSSIGLLIEIKNLLEKISKEP